MYDNWQIKNTFTKIMKKLDEDRPLRNILIVIFLVIGFYYFASPYENCKRDFKSYYGEYAEYKKDFQVNKIMYRLQKKVQLTRAEFNDREKREYENYKARCGEYNNW
mgnify:CR=1 FL=1